MQACVAMLYFAVTTLSTVGFGDYHPHTSAERAIMTIILFSGVIIFSLMMGVFVEILRHYRTLTAENEDSANLARFFGLMQKYNKGQALHKSVIREYERYFMHLWEKDKINFLRSEEGNRLFLELPPDIKTQIFKNFLFGRFIQKFRKLFDLPKNKKMLHTCFTWGDEKFVNFMIQILRTLEPRFYTANAVIYEELEEILEMTFLMKGGFRIGYEINKT